MPMNNVEKLTDEELQIAATELERRKKLAEEKIEQEHLARTVKLLQHLAQHPELVAVLVPEHRPGRYGRVCTDADPSGAYRVDPKDWHCERCRLLDAISDCKSVEIGETKAQWHFSIVLECTD